MLQSEFDIMRMRDHLHNCIENLELTPFPKLRRKLKLLKQTEKVLNYSIAADRAALCEFPNSYNDMVQCDTKTCQNWFHYKCMIPPNVKKFNSNPSPISFLCLAVLTQSAYNLGQGGGGGGGGHSHFFSKKPQK